VIEILRLPLGVLAAWLLVAAAASGEDPAFLRGDALYQHGEGNPAGFSEAIVAFQAAAKKGHTESAFYAGRMHHLGHGVEVDPEQAADWYALAVEQGHAGACNNLANVYTDQGRKAEDILDLLFLGAKRGSVVATFNVAQYSKGGLAGVRKDYARAAEYYRKTLELQPGYPTAWNHLGRLYEKGGFGLDRDLAAAEEAYLKAIETEDDKHAYYNLYRLYWFGRRPAGEKPALFYLEAAAERGFGKAAWRAARHHRYGWGNTPQDLVKAAYFLDLGAEARHGSSITESAKLASNPQLVKHYGEAVTRQWSERRTRWEDSARQDVARDLARVRPIFESGDEEAAVEAMDQAPSRWNERTVDDFFYYHIVALWHEIQVGGGRDDPEWGRFLAAWLTRTLEADERSHIILGARINLHANLVETGRYGQVRDSCAAIKRLLKALEGVDVDAVLATVEPDENYEIPDTATIPLETDPVLARRSQAIDYDVTVQSVGPIGGQAMTTLGSLADERLAVGDWESVLVLAEWIERWCHDLRQTDRRPERSYPGCLRELEQMSAEFRSKVFAALGFPDREAASWQAILDLNYRDSYGGRLLQLAQYRLAKIRVAQGNADEVSIEALQTLESRMRANQYQRSEDWQLAKLVRARAIAATSRLEPALSLVDEVLADAAEKTRPLIRLEALLVSAELKLNAGTTAGVESSLKEALGWARAKGFVFGELRIVELYVTYLITIGDFDGALTMQRRVLELIDGLNLSPRRQPALLRLAKIYSHRGNHAEARQIAENITAPDLVERARLLAGENEAEKDMPTAKPHPAAEPIDIQPMGIRSAPSLEGTEAVFILTNPNPMPDRAKAIFESEQFQFVREEAAEGELAILATPGGNGRGEGLVVEIEVPGSTQMPVIVTVAGAETLPHEVRVGLRVSSSGVPGVRSSDWWIEPDREESTVSVIDAAQLRNNAFALAPVFHHLASGGSGPARAAIRVVASEPTRIEGFSSDGALLFVDAQGNGSFLDPGDLVATDDSDGLFPLLSTDSDYRFALRYRPLAEETNERVELHIQTRPPGATADWKTDATDWLEP
jgi:TPR repeat protein